jgi:hypothetical protein
MPWPASFFCCTLPPFSMCGRSFVDCLVYYCLHYLFISLLCWMFFPYPRYSWEYLPFGWYYCILQYDTCSTHTAFVSNSHSHVYKSADVLGRQCLCLCWIRDNAGPIGTFPRPRKMLYEHWEQLADILSAYRSLTRPSAVTDTRPMACHVWIVPRLHLLAKRRWVLTCRTASYVETCGWQCRYTFVTT